MTACIAPTLPQAKTACAWSPHTSRLHTLPCMTRARLCDRSRLTVRHTTVYSVAICCHIDHICGLILQNDRTPLLPYVASLLRCLCLLPYPAICGLHMASLLRCTHNRVQCCHAAILALRPRRGGGTRPGEARNCGEPTAHGLHQYMPHE